MFFYCVIAETFIELTLFQKTHTALISLPGKVPGCGPCICSFPHGHA